MLRLHDFLDSGNGYKVRLLLRQLERPFQRIDVDILKGESRTREFLEKNLNGRIPVLELESGETLPESNAILFYLAEGTRFLPDDPLGRARVLQWMFFEQYSHEPNIATVRFWVKHVEMDDKRMEAAAQKRELGYQALQVMDRHLADRTFFVAETYTIADIALFAYTHVAEEGGFDLSGFPNVNAWLDRVRRQPGWLPLDRA